MWEALQGIVTFCNSAGFLMMIGVALHMTYQDKIKPWDKYPEIKRKLAAMRARGCQGADTEIIRKALTVYLRYQRRRNKRIRISHPDTVRAVIVNANQLQREGNQEDDNNHSG